MEQNLLEMGETLCLAKPLYTEAHLIPHQQKLCSFMKNYTYFFIVEVSEPSHDSKLLVSIVIVVNISLLCL